MYPMGQQGIYRVGTPKSDTLDPDRHGGAHQEEVQRRRMKRWSQRRQRGAGASTLYCLSLFEVGGFACVRTRARKNATLDEL